MIMEYLACEVEKGVYWVGRLNCNILHPSVMTGPPDYEGNIERIKHSFPDFDV